MNEKLCFTIEGEELYLDKVLVDYHDIPIFFICIGARGYYVVLCTNMEELSYIIVKPSLSELNNMLHGKITMREIFAKQLQYWEVRTGNTVSSDAVLLKNICEANLSDYPDKGARFEILTSEEEEYVKRIDEQISNNDMEL